MAKKEVLVTLKRRELEAMQQIKHEEAKQRAEHIAIHAREAADRDAEERERMRVRITQKMGRAEAIQEQREQLASEMGR